MVTGTPEFQVEKEGVCPGCVEGKLKRGPFPSSQSKTSDILRLVHLGISEASINRETTTPQTPEEKFIGKKPDVSHFRIFGSPVYFHVPKEKRNKLGASGKKGIFLGYGENTKGYRIYVAGQREVEISHDVTFDDDMALSKVDNLPTLRSTQEADTTETKEKEETMPNAEEPLDPIDPPLPELSSSRKRPSWLRGTLDDAEGHTAPRGTFRESKKPNRYQGYLTIMNTIIHKCRQASSMEGCYDRRI